MLKLNFFFSKKYQVYTETLNSRNLKVENPSQNDILGFVNDEIMLRQIEKNIKIFTSQLFLLKNANFIFGITQPSVSYTKCLTTFLYEPAYMDFLFIQL